jgi:hypothetical protein
VDAKVDEDEDEEKREDVVASFGDGCLRRLWMVLKNREVAAGDFVDTDIIVHLHSPNEKPQTEQRQHDNV